MVYPCYLLSRQCLAQAKATPSPRAPAPPPPPPPPPPSPPPPGWEQSDRHVPHSPSHGMVPSSLAREGTGVPSSSTHQQWPRCMPLEERHCVTLKERGRFGKGKRAEMEGGKRWWERQREKMICHHSAAAILWAHSWEAQREVSVILSPCGHTLISGCTKRRAAVECSSDTCTVTPSRCSSDTFFQSHEHNKVPLSRPHDEPADNTPPAFSCRSRGCHSWVYRCRGQTRRLSARDPSGHYWAACDRVPENSNAECDFKHRHRRAERTCLHMKSGSGKLLPPPPRPPRWLCWQKSSLQNTCDVNHHGLATVMQHYSQKQSECTFIYIYIDQMSHIAYHYITTLLHKAFAFQVTDWFEVTLRFCATLRNWTVPSWPFRWLLHSTYSIHIGSNAAHETGSASEKIRSGSGRLETFLIPIMLN